MEEEEEKLIGKICLVGCCTIIVVVLGDSFLQALPTINCIFKLFKVNTNTQVLV